MFFRLRTPEIGTRREALGHDTHPQSWPLVSVKMPEPARVQYDVRKDGRFSEWGIFGATSLEIVSVPGGMVLSGKTEAGGMSVGIRRAPHGHVSVDLLFDDVEIAPEVMVGDMFTYRSTREEGESSSCSGSGIYSDRVKIVTPIVGGEVALYMGRINPKP